MLMPRFLKNYITSILTYLDERRFGGAFLLYQGGDARVSTLQQRSHSATVAVVMSI